MLLFSHENKHFLVIHSLNMFMRLCPSNKRVDMSMRRKHHNTWMMCWQFLNTSACLRLQKYLYSITLSLKGATLVIKNHYNSRKQSIQAGTYVFIVNHVDEIKTFVFLNKHFSMSLTQRVFIFNHIVPKRSYRLV